MHPHSIKLIADPAKLVPVELSRNQVTWKDGLSLAPGFRIAIEVMAEPDEPQLEPEEPRLDLYFSFQTESGEVHPQERIGNLSLDVFRHIRLDNSLQDVLTCFLKEGGSGDRLIHTNLTRLLQPYFSLTIGRVPEGIGFTLIFRKTGGKIRRPSSITFRTILSIDQFADCLVFSQP